MMPQAETSTEARIQIKVCGLTDPGGAAACAAAGVDAVGLVFYPKSPRFVDDALASEISAAISGKAVGVGVFVNEPVKAVLAKTRRCGLAAVQLHGQEPPGAVAQLRAAGLLVIKALFHERAPQFADASRYDAAAFLLECGRGRLPGGNARTWDWGAARLNTVCPLVLAGGLTPDNVGRAVALGLPDAVDVSSGVETAPGVKDLSKVAAFVAAVRGCRSARFHPTRRIFR
jgi:phosphoribosylanthranilate isomerase